MFEKQMFNKSFYRLGDTMHLRSGTFICLVLTSLPFASFLSCGSSSVSLPPVRPPASGKIQARVISQLSSFVVKLTQTLEMNRMNRFREQNVVRHLSSKPTTAVVQSLYLYVFHSHVQVDIHRNHDTVADALRR